MTTRDYDTKPSTPGAKRLSDARSGAALAADDADDGYHPSSSGEPSSGVERVVRRPMRIVVPAPARPLPTAQHLEEATPNVSSTVVARLLIAVALGLLAAGLIFMALTRASGKSP